MLFHQVEVHISLSMTSNFAPSFPTNEAELASVFDQLLKHYGNDSAEKKDVCSKLLLQGCKGPILNEGHVGTLQFFVEQGADVNFIDKVCTRNYIILENVKLFCFLFYCFPGWLFTFIDS